MKKKQKKINFIVELDACDFSNKLCEFFTSIELYTHDNTFTLSIEWNDNDFILFKEWLLETYGEVIKKYNRFAIIGT